ncbi:MAG: FumA C-terminus/TtdB family hydratase beta subunit [Firmicutes bacterium]|nr:FumA C-terminus/TtdB family hydratase beta subunit [Bacillota bacterium]
MIEISLPIKNPEKLKAGDKVLLTGTIFTARDMAHKRMCETPNSLPFNFINSAVYYAGPCPAPKGHIIGSIGPTTSGRMDKYSPTLIAKGLKIMIGKGDRSSEVIETIKKHKGLYFVAIGGAGALYASCVKSAKIIAYEDLGTEAIYELQVEKMPLVVGIDTKGEMLATCNRESNKAMQRGLGCE